MPPPTITTAAMKNNDERASTEQPARMPPQTRERATIHAYRDTIRKYDPISATGPTPPGTMHETSGIIGARGMARTAWDRCGRSPMLGASIGASAAPGAVRPTARVAACPAGAVYRMDTQRTTYAATAARPLSAVRSLSGGGGARFDRRNANGVNTVFAVLAERVDRWCQPTDYRVRLPIRPNGSTGWVRARDVRLQTVHTRIAVDLSQRRITLFRDGRPILVATAVVGAASTPTPTGHYYVNQRLRAANPWGDYGLGAVGISAFSPVLVNWPQGGPIAIHGTNAPGLIGTAVSHGCLRVRETDIRLLLRLAVEGTPVEIKP